MVGWRHQLNGHEFEQTLRDSEGQRGQACCSPWVVKSQTQLSNWTKIDHLSCTITQWDSVHFFSLFFSLFPEGIHALAFLACLALGRRGPWQQSKSLCKETQYWHLEVGLAFVEMVKTKEMHPESWQLLCLHPALPQVQVPAQLVSQVHHQLRAQVCLHTQGKHYGTSRAGAGRNASTNQGKRKRADIILGGGSAVGNAVQIALAVFHSYWKAICHLCHHPSQYQ